MGVGAVILACMLAGCVVALFIADGGDRRAVRAGAIGLACYLIIKQLLIPLDTNYIEGELRVLALAIVPISAAALLGSWIRKMRLRRGSN